MKLLNQMKQTTELEGIGFDSLLTAVYETIEIEAVEHDLLCKYIHIVNQLKENKDITPLEYIPSNLDFTDDTTIRLVHNKVFELADYIMEHMSVEEFSKHIKDYKQIKAEAREWM
ncbi:hypothetical protein VL10_ORF23 [Staphylococcus phage vB_SauM_VL10]|nr:hypothetical protein VL10_ORF23 [Staphylococcus phage vB_SauM_VL10]